MDRQTDRSSSQSCPVLAVQEKDTRVWYGIYTMVCYYCTAACSDTLPVARSTSSGHRPIGFIWNRRIENSIYPMSSKVCMSCPALPALDPRILKPQTWAPRSPSRPTQRHALWSSSALLPLHQKRAPEARETPGKKRPPTPVGRAHLVPYPNEPRRMQEPALGPQKWKHASAATHRSGLGAGAELEPELPLTPPSLLALALISGPA